MLSIHALSSGVRHHFYLSKEAIGEWVGVGSEILGLPQQVSAEEFHAIRKGLDPETGEPLRVRKVVDRQYHKPWGIDVYRAREMYDLTVSAPKTISIQGIIDPKMHEAHRAAVAEVRHQMERCCGAMVIAKYEHGYSRRLDPLIHTHLLAANLAHDGHKWRTLHANNLYRSTSEINTDYRVRLAEMLDSWGYKIEVRRGVPELANVPAEIGQRFSQRAAQINAALLERAADRGVRPDQLTSKEKAIIVRINRPKKEYSKVPGDIQAYQLSRLTPAEHARLESIAGQAMERSHGEKKGISNWEPYERPALRHPWNYGEDGDGSVMVSNRPNRVRMSR